MDAADVAFLDEDFLECWWVGEYEANDLILQGWATKQGDRALVYVTGGGLWSGTPEEYREFHRRVAREARAKREAGTLTSPRRYEALRKGACDYLRRYRRETGGLPSRSTWLNAWLGEIDSGGRQITAELVCATCRKERVVSLAGTEARGFAVFQDNGFKCSMVNGAVCGEASLLGRGNVFDFVPAGPREVPAVAERPRTPTAVKTEVSRDNEGNDDLEIVGFSSAAKQFYKARGP